MASNNTSSCQLSAELLNIAEVCTRIGRWASKPSPLNSPLLNLAKDRVQQLVTAAENFCTKLTCLDAGLRNTSIHSHEINCIRELMCESLYLFDLCSHPNTDLCGDDGAINAVFASMFLSGHPHQVDGNTSYDRVKGLRLANELEQTLSPWFGPNQASQNYQWGLPSAPPPPLAIITEAGPRLLRSIDKYLETCQPRYIHSYSTFNDSPYIVDKSTVTASGSFGTVRKVFQKQTGDEFAAKSFHNILSNSNRNKIRRELGCLELCIHPNLISLVEAFEIKDDPHTITIIMAPWAPSTLWTFLHASDVRRKIEFPWFEPNALSSYRYIYRIMFDIAAGVAFLHERSIKHKDIKPQNILLYTEDTGTIRPIITDVGETKVYRAGTFTDPKRSSYEYLAPEQQLEGEDVQSDLKADIWQLGCCFAMLLAVTRSGLFGLEKLWNSFTDTAENCSCNIANESVKFMTTLHDICLPESISQKHVHWVVTRMLDTNPITRFDIQNVRAELANLDEMDSVNPSKGGGSRACYIS